MSAQFLTKSDESMSAAYYNEHDPYAAQWLRNLIAAGYIAPGDSEVIKKSATRTSDLLTKNEELLL